MLFGTRSIIPPRRALDTRGIVIKINRLCGGRSIATPCDAVPRSATTSNAA
jgi:hypothetical protein